MDAKQPPRRELQGPRPTPLKVRKDSHKIKKPPVAPAKPQPTAAPMQHRPPIIIYAVSPKVIHTNPSEFMSLVQRLTGSSSASAAAASSPTPLPPPVTFPDAATTSAFPYTSFLSPGFLSGTTGIGGLSPAARLATIEQGRKETRIDSTVTRSREDDLMLMSQFGIDVGPRLDRVGLSPSGILSPVPSSLPVISPNLFSPLNNNVQAAGGLGFLHDLSPLFAANRLITGNNFFATTPGGFFAANTPTSNILSITTPVVPSPGAYSWDLFNHQYQDL